MKTKLVVAGLESRTSGPYSNLFSHLRSIYVRTLSFSPNCLLNQKGCVRCIYLNQKLKATFSYRLISPAGPAHIVLDEQQLEVISS